jgi:ribosomal protein S18 acetylase RimI-like enzyme
MRIKVILMSLIEIFPINATHPAFGSAVTLFTQYRKFYGQVPDAAKSQRFLLDRLRREQSTLLVATVDGKAAGIAQLYNSFSSIQCSHTVVLNDLFVSPSYRALGVGRKLVDAAIGVAKEHGASSIQLETEQDNEAAQQLYRRMGFERSTGSSTLITCVLKLNNLSTQVSA